MDSKASGRERDSVVSWKINNILLVEIGVECFRKKLVKSPSWMGRLYMKMNVGGSGSDDSVLTSGNVEENFERNAVDEFSLKSFGKFYVAIVSIV